MQAATIDRALQKVLAAIPPLVGAGELAAQLVPRFRDLMDTAVERGRQHIEEDALRRLEAAIDRSREIPPAAIRHLSQAATWGAERAARKMAKAQIALAVMFGLAIAAGIGLASYSVGYNAGAKHVAVSRPLE